VDGTVIETVNRVAELSWTPKPMGKQHSAYRLHTRFDVLGGKAAQIAATSASPKANQRAVLQQTTEADPRTIPIHLPGSRRAEQGCTLSGSSPSPSACRHKQ
jgi:hypothetical protein